MTQVDVLLPVKGPAPWLIETLSSLKAQTYQNWKLVAAIQGVDPDVSQLIQRFFPEAVQINARADGNLASTLNAGLAFTTSEFIARIDADDIALPMRLAKQVQFFEDQPLIDVVGSAAFLIGPHGENLGLRKQESDSSKIYKSLRWKCPLIHPSTMFRSNLVKSIGGYSEAAINVEDYDLWLRLARQGALGGIDEPLIKYRIHPQQVTQSRTIPRSASAEIRKSKEALAIHKNEYAFFAHGRHLAWELKQEIRRMRRR